MADIPNCPRGREEEYLSDIAGLTDNAPNNPWSRKEAYLAAIDGKMDNIEEQIAALSADISFKGSVPTADDLPETAAVGDAYITEDTGIIYVYVGESGTEPWVALGGSGGGSGIIELTSADYDWPEATPNGVALWKLPTGIYKNSYNVKIYCSKDTDTLAPGITIVNNDESTTTVDILFVGALGSTSPYGSYFRVTRSNGQNSVQSTTSNTSKPYAILYAGYVVNDLKSDKASFPLSAKQGRELNDKIDALELTNSEFNTLWENA